jgi:hypothetical protein
MKEIQRPKLEDNNRTKRTERKRKMQSIAVHSDFLRAGIALLLSLYRFRTDSSSQLLCLHFAAFLPTILPRKIDVHCQERHSIRRYKQSSSSSSSDLLKKKEMKERTNKYPQNIQPPRISTSPSTKHATARLKQPMIESTASKGQKNTHSSPIYRYKTLCTHSNNNE